MRFDISDIETTLVLASLEKQHRELLDKASSWSFDLEGDYDTYVNFRQQELRLAALIHTMKRQRTFQQNNPDRKEPLADWEKQPLADWEKELLSGESIGADKEARLDRLEAND